MTPRRREKHKPDQIVAKLRDALASERRKELAAVLQALEISEATLARWRAGLLTRELVRGMDAATHKKARVRPGWPGGLTREPFRSSRSSHSGAWMPRRIKKPA